MHTLNTHHAQIKLPTSQVTLKHQHLLTSPSTNSELINWVKSERIDALYPYLLTASMQTAGRGQRGRTWHSPKGNVYLSLYYPMDRPISGLLSLVVGYHLTQINVIAQINQLRREQSLANIGLKWANDIGYYQSEAPTMKTVSFNKLAGILIEPILKQNHLIGVVIGVGMNVLSPPTLCTKKQEGFNYQAIGLISLITANQHILKHKSNETVRVLPSLNELYLQIADGLCQAVTHFIQMQKTHRFDGFLNQFNRVDVLKNKYVRIVQEHSNNPKLTGIAKGIDKTGSMQLYPDHSDDAKPIAIFTGRVERIK